jgi:hypothetical protein
MGHSCRTLVEEQSLLFSVRLACHRVRKCTDREQPRRKIVRRRQVTRTSRPHSKKWRALGCYLPSKWSGWTVRKRRERGKRPADPLGNLRRAQMFAERSVLPCRGDERVRDPALSLSGGIFFWPPPRRGFDLVRQLERFPAELNRGFPIVRE